MDEKLLRTAHAEPEISDEILIKRVSALDEDAFTQLYQRYAPRMLRYFYRMLNQDEELAQDFVQDLFLKLIEKADRFDARHKFSTWIFTLAANMCKNEYRKRNIRDQFKVNQSYNESVLNPRIEDHIDQQAFSQELTQALERLSPDQKNAFILRYQEGLSVKEISQISRCAQGTVKSRIYYGLKKLANNLAVYRSQE